MTKNIDFQYITSANFGARYFLWNNPFNFES